MTSHSQDPAFRRARAEDVPGIVAMLADDRLGARRETPDDLAPYQEAFKRIDADANQHLIVAELDGRLVGCLQLSVIHGLGRRASTRGIIEAVRVSSAERGAGLGTKLIAWSIDEARRLGVDFLQLTSDNTRADAHRFYERLGFKATHVGFKMQL